MTARVRGTPRGERLHGRELFERKARAPFLPGRGVARLAKTQPPRVEDASPTEAGLAPGSVGPGHDEGPWLSTRLP